MPGTVSEGPPSVPMTFANNFWGKDDAGVHPLLERMHNAKTTCDELKAFYRARAELEDEYARKMLALSRKPLGSRETGTLRDSMNVLRGEVESVGKSHQNIAQQMKTELEEPLAAFAGAMKERRKIVQGGTEKLLKTKIQQTQLVNKTRDRYEQECLKIKGYLAQGHMVMGQEERKNKAKLEKTQINVATTNTEYEAAVKALEETTQRWNRDWKAAADKFQDLEEERLDFTKSSLWAFANIASTVCVSDDASCEKIRLSLENCEVEKDIVAFIKERGTGQEIPDAPKYINFCRGDASDTQSETSEDDNYSVAQFPRTLNPVYRTSSPQPSTYESHHDPNSELARQLGHHEPDAPSSREATVTPQKALAEGPRGLESLMGRPRQQSQLQLDYRQDLRAPAQLQYDQAQMGQLSAVPHDPYPLDGMTMLCRTGPPSHSDRSSAHSGMRPSSRDDNSDYSNPTSFSSMEPPSGQQSPMKQEVMIPQSAEKSIQKKKSGFFQSHSPFRRKSKHEKDSSSAVTTPTNKNTWAPQKSGYESGSTPSRRPGLLSRGATQNSLTDRGDDGEPIDPRANFQLNIGNNVLDVEMPNRNKPQPARPQDDMRDPIAEALAELKGVTKQSSSRITADAYSGIATPAPGATPNRIMANADVRAGMRGTPPPSYEQPASSLALPKPAFTSKAMQQTSKQYQTQTQNMFRSSHGRSESSPGYSQGRPPTRSGDVPRATSPMPNRAVSPRPSPQNQQSYNRSVSPNPYGGSQRGQPQQRGSDQYHRGNSPGDANRAISPAPYRPNSRMSGGDMSIQLAPVPQDDGYGSNRSRHGGNRYATAGQNGPMGHYGGHGGGAVQLAQPQQITRQRSKSVAGGAQYNRDGRPIIHFARAQYNYTAAIPEELSFSKGETLAVLRLQDDGWWEAEITGKNQRPGLVPSNYLQVV